MYGMRILIKVNTILYVLTIINDMGGGKVTIQQ